MSRTLQTEADREAAAVLRRVGAATAYEAYGRMGLLDIDLRAVRPGARVAGPALTVGCAQDDNLAVHAAVEETVPGSIVVITMPDPRPVALVGELLALQFEHRGAAGLLVDAAVRDVDVLRDLEMPIWARSVRVRGATKAGAGSVGDPVTIGGTRIATGDLIVLDDDGAVAVQRRDLGAVAHAAAGRARREAEIATAIRGGATTLHIHGLRDRWHGS